MAEPNSEPTTAPGGTGATPVSPPPVTGTPAPAGATPVDATLALAAAQKQIADLEHSQKNATEEVERHRRKLAQYEKQEQEAAAAKKAADDAQLSEIERIKKQAAEAEAQVKLYQQQLVLAEIRMRAGEKGILNPELITPYVHGKLDFDKDGKATNLDAVLDELIKGNPNMLAPASPAPPPTPATGGQPPTAPATPVGNPGRSSIPSPAAGGGQTGKPPSWSEVTWSR